MRQVSKKASKPSAKKKTTRSSVIKKGKVPKKRNHPKFGTSKLEDDFARDFLDKLGVEYIWQFEAKDIGRFFDYYLPNHNLIIEIDGSWFHSDPRLVKEEDMNRMQKKNKRVDAYKDKWALMHGIPIMRIWEKDIRENPKGVMSELKKRLYIEEEKVTLKKEMGKRHVNRLNKK